MSVGNIIAFISLILTFIATFIAVMNFKKKKDDDLEGTVHDFITNSNITKFHNVIISNSDKKVYKNFFLKINKLTNELLKTIFAKETIIQEKYYFYLFIGNLFLIGGYYNKAINFYKKAIQLNNTLPWAWNNLGNVYCLKRNVTEALDAFNYALKDDKKISTLYFNRAIAHFLIHNYTKVVDDFKKVIEYNCQVEYFYYFQQKIEKNEKRIQKYYEKAYQDSFYYLYKIGYRYHRQKEYKKAIFFYSKAIEIKKIGEKFKLDIYEKRGDCYLAINDFAKAENDFSLILSYFTESHLLKESILIKKYIKSLLHQEKIPIVEKFINQLMQIIHYEDHRKKDLHYEPEDITNAYSILISLQKSIQLFKAGKINIKHLTKF